jgi:hypothetical protein
MSRHESIFGYIIATVMIIMFISCIFLSIFNFVFEKHDALYGIRGEFYMNE